jgi:cytochrome d ubiquinol oxidase subunit II
VGTLLAHRRGRPGLAFASWSTFAALLLASAAFSLYPWLLPSSIDPTYALGIDQARAADRSLRIGAVWWPIGIALAVAYTVHAHRRFSAPVEPRA